MNLSRNLTRFRNRNRKGNHTGLCSLACLIAFFVVSGCSQTQTVPDFPEPESLPSIQLKEAPPESVPFGTPLELHLRITASERVDLPPLGDWLEPPVELLDSSSSESLSEDRWQRDVTLTAAVYAVTNTTLFVSAPLIENPELTLPFASLEITSRLDPEVTPVPRFGSGEMPDFRGPEALRRRTRNLFISLSALGLLVLLILFPAWKWRRRIVPPPPPVPAHVIAFRALEQLQQDPIWTTPNVDASATALSLILRTYIEDRFGIQAPDLTTEEFLLAVEQDAPWSDSEQAGLQRFFAATDRIKFAGDRPERSILQELMSSVHDFVQGTRQEASV